ncbi:MAG: GAF domain-containing protein, partial [Thiovulaceae bacterium]|nr:GAF domain-containing protein [Sulfurimonadaceae bacterium]
MNDSPLSSDHSPERKIEGWVIWISVFLLTAIVSAAVIWKIEESRFETKRAEVTQIANKHSVNLRQTIDQILSLTYPFAAMLHHDGAVFHFEPIAKKLITFYPLISMIALAPEGRIKEIVPLSGNEKAFGFDLFSDPLHRTEALRARNTGRLTLAGPLELVQGGEALVGRLPVFRGEEKKFWGFVVIAIRFPDILNSAALGKLEHQGYQYTLTRLHPVSKKEQTIASSGGGALDQPVEKIIDVPNGQWILRIAPINGWYDRWLLAVEAALAIFISILLGYIAKQYAELRNYRYSLEALVEKRTSEITETRNLLHTLLDTIPDLISLKNREGSYLLCNPMFERFFGAKEEAIVGKSDYDFVDRELADLFRQTDRLAVESKGPVTNEEWVTFADDSRPTLLETVKIPMYDERQTLTGVLGVARDITKRHNSEMHIKRLTQMYATLSQCNKAIVYSSTPQELFDKICEHTVSLGGMDMAWIGLIDPTTGLLRPAASYGEGTRYLAGIEISVREDMLSGRGPTGIAVREDRPYWCQDFMQDPATAPWHEHGEAMGWRASAALPIHLYDKVIGAFMIYSQTRNTFDSLMQKLIIEMTMDISFAMENFDRETKRKAAETHLAKTEKLLEEMSSMAHVGGWEFDLKSGSGAWTKEIANIYDLDPNDPTSIAIGLSVYQGEWLKKIQTAQDVAIHKKIPYDLELLMETAKGNKKWVRTIGIPVVERGEVVRLRGSMQDITAQKMAEEKVHWLANFDPLTGLPNRTLLNDRVAHA